MENIEKMSIDDKIEYWHTHETGNSLREFLGMTEQEYLDFCLPTQAIENIKKAIKHFECVKSDAKAVLDSGFGKNPNESNIVYKNRKLYAELAINALKKEMPKNVNISLKGTTCWNTKCHCPICHKDLFDSQKYCSNCGQLIDWGGANG